ncbi:hypothetical protein E8E13_004566 [Curvularia kusanoi]|uniref:Uncharacterized protein n=1 Tax=Curvularia kusanoi TaxID=90978 RepID=A0A9P4TKB4_CURKU|nr:hypothetical protein E8E13_004566 [Curvularia kusanoi]
MPADTGAQKRQSRLASLIAYAQAHNGSLAQAYAAYHGLEIDTGNASLEPSRQNRPLEASQVQLQAKRLLRNSSDAINSAVRSNRASKTLQQVLGMRGPEPLVAPPVMPDDLIRNFEAVLSMHGHHTGELNASTQGKSDLADIAEEDESPVLASPSEITSMALDKGKQPEVNSSQHASRSNTDAPRQTFLDSDSDASVDGASEPMDTETEGEHCDQGDQSSTATAINDDLEPNSTDFVLNRSFILDSNESLSTLFSPASIEPQAPDFDIASHELAQTVSSRRRSRRSFSDRDMDFEASSSSETPLIRVHEPSTARTSTSKKRTASPSAQSGFGQPQVQRARRDENTGLPILSSEEAAKHTEDFPGSTHALLTVLLTWSHTIWSLHQRIPDPTLFSNHPAFPYPITPPVAQALVSVSFYDTSVSPHKELHFLGPSDAAELSYHEIDTFSAPKTTQPLSHRSSSSPPNPLKHSPRPSTTPQSPTHTRYTSMSHRATTGEGRWCYILAKAHAPRDGSTAPHVLLAWHTSCVTGTSTCLHTISPEEPSASPHFSATSTQPHRPSSRLKHVSSLQDFTQARRAPKRFGLRQALSSEIEHELEARGKRAAKNADSPLHA